MYKSLKRNHLTPVPSNIFFYFLTDKLFKTPHNRNKQNFKVKKWCHMKWNQSQNQINNIASLHFLMYSFIEFKVQIPYFLNQN